MDTIFALATARGKAGVAVVRISGPLAFWAAKNLAGSIPPPRKSAVRSLQDSNGILLDEALVLCFENGASFTGEESVELHLHGSIAIVNAVLENLSKMDGLRPAEAGEFTRRALENERLDLAQVEGLADLIEAETEVQRRQALNVFSGALGEKTQLWRSNLLRAAALLEATIDFADEEVPTDVSPEVMDLLNETSVSFEEELKGAVIAERIRDGFEVAILGAPNAGKSTLLNALAGRDAAITSEIAGTTRDVIEVRLDLSGIPVTLLDTAGLRDTVDVVEAMGIDRAKQRAENADLRIVLLVDDGETLPVQVNRDDLVLIGKDDDGHLKLGKSISGKTGHGVEWLIKEVSDILAHRTSSASTLIRARHQSAISDALMYLESAKSEIQVGFDRTELAAEELRSAIRRLDSLVGRIDAESLLGEIFSSFCIGK